MLSDRLFTLDPMCRCSDRIALLKKRRDTAHPYEPTHDRKKGTHRSGFPSVTASQSALRSCMWNVVLDGCRHAFEEREGPDVARFQQYLVAEVLAGPRCRHGL